MPSVRPYVTAGVALVGASVVAVTPITSMQPDIRSASMNVDLVAAVTTTTPTPKPATTTVQQPNQAAIASAAQAAPSVFNIPANLFIALANVPYNFFNALGMGDVNLGSNPDSAFSFINGKEGISLTQTGVVGLAADLAYGGSWWVYQPENVLGTDSADIARYQALLNLAIPFPALSVGLGNIVTTIAASQLPMDKGCTGTSSGGCPDINGILSKMFDLRHVVDLFSPGGYTFPTVTNPVSCSSDGLCDVFNGTEEEPWSGQNVKLNIFDPFENFYDSLTATPDFSQIKIPTPEFITASLVSLVKGLNTAFNPFVPGTQCGLCSLFVPIPAGTTRPGPTNPGVQIPGIPGSENPGYPPGNTGTTTLVANDTTATTAPKQTFFQKLAATQEAKADAKAAAAAVDAKAAPAADTTDATDATATTPKKGGLFAPKTTTSDDPVSAAVKSLQDKFSAAKADKADKAADKAAAKADKAAAKADKADTSDSAKADKSDSAKSDSSSASKAKNDTGSKTKSGADSKE
jgi:hypothetical protein